MKWKVHLRYGLYDARNMPGIRSMKVQAKYALGPQINEHLHRLGLQKTKTGAWCSDSVTLADAAANLPEIMKIFANPREVKNTTGELDYLCLYIERY